MPRSTPASDAMWRTYWKKRSGVLIGSTARRNTNRRNRNALALHYQPFTLVVAEMVRKRFANIYDTDELAQMAMVALIEAIARYDPAGAKSTATFETYVNRRLFGELYDVARSQSALPRHHEAPITDAQEAYRAVHGQLEEPISLDTPTGTHGAGVGLPDQQTLGDIIPAVDADPAEMGYPSSERHDALVRAMRRLTPTQRKVIRMHDFEGVYLKTIGVLLGVSESRVCQIRSQALRKLRQTMGVG